MGINWFWRSRNPSSPASDRLAHAIAEGRAGEIARAVTELAAERAEPGGVFLALSELRARSWLQLDVALRSWRSAAAAHPKWSEITATAGSDPLALLLAACSGDGRVRQRAVNTPLMRHDQRLLPLLLIRTADWVKQVRDDARAAVAEALDNADADGFVRAAGIAMAMREWQRGQHAAAAVTKALHNRVDGTVDAARASDDVEVRRFAYRLWLESSQADTEAIIGAALSEPDIVCHQLCAEAATRAAVRDGRQDTLARLLSARFAEVRAEAIHGLVRSGRPESAASALADRSAFVRTSAQWAMRRAGLDSAERYRSMIASGDPSSLRGAVAGLGECGTVDDAESLAAFLMHDRPRVRAETIRAVHRLGGSLGQIVDLLTDPSPTVVRAAAAALRDRADLVPVDLLWRLLANDQPQHVRHAAFSQLVARDAWIRVEADLALIADRRDELRAHARANLIAWLSHDAATTYTRPLPSARDRLRRLVDAAEPEIGRARADAIRFLLDLSP